MADLQIYEYNVGDIGTNCYFLVNTDTKEAIVVDPGGSVPMLEKNIRNLGITPVAIFLTHAHYDHAHGVKELKGRYPVPVYVSKAERELMCDAGMNVSSMFGCAETYEADVFLSDGDHLDTAGFSIEVIHTPGHTPGGCCYYFPENKVLISGDTLFAESVGRTDFPGGSMSQLVRGIREKLMVLPRDTGVYPGHMGHTTIGHEADYNPFL
ncbi:MAG: MBL fold metallo-hydrolase [Clostridiales bacterium]|nr:MBL fold metallo-hydrolase [Clostridiales bacterium]